MVIGPFVKLFELDLFVTREEVGATSSELAVAFIHSWNCAKDERRRFQSYRKVHRNMFNQLRDDVNNEKLLDESIPLRCRGSEEYECKCKS